MTDRNIYNDILFGIAVGDALGVPVEFNSRHTIALKPVTDMIAADTRQSNNCGIFLASCIFFSLYFVLPETFRSFNSAPAPAAGAEDRYRWCGSDDDGKTNPGIKPPCRCKHCKEQGVIRINH